MGVGFALTNDAVQDIRDTAKFTVYGVENVTIGNLTETRVTETSSGWVGNIPEDYWLGYWIDTALLIIIGGIPWQVSV